MTVLTENLQTMTGVNWRREVRFYVPLVEGGYAAAGAIATAVVVVVPDDAGVITTPDLLPGRAQVRIDGHSYDFDIPDSASPVALAPLLGLSIDYPPPVVEEAQEYAMAAAASAAEAASAVGAQIVSTIAALKSRPTASSYVEVAGYYAAGDGGGGLFRWDSTDTSSADNGGTIIAPTSSLSSSGRWKRVYEGEVNARWFGVNTSQSDNTAALQRAVDWVSKRPYPDNWGGVVLTPEGWYPFKFDAGTSGLSTITISAWNVTIRGEGAGTALLVTNHARPNQLNYFFTFSWNGGQRGNGGGVHDIYFAGNCMLKWCIYLGSWRAARFENIWASDLHSGVLDAVHTDTGNWSENIVVRALDHSMPNGGVSQYMVRFRSAPGDPSILQWTDCWIEDIAAIGCWDTGVVLDNCVRMAVRDVVSAWNSTTTNTVDGTSRTGALHAVSILTTVELSQASGWHVVDSIYFESTTGSETPAVNNAVFIQQPGHNAQTTWNRISNIQVSGTPGLSGFLRLKDDSGVGRLNNTTFTGNRQALVGGSSIIIGASVDQTDLYLTPDDGRAWDTLISDAGTNTRVNGLSPSGLAVRPPPAVYDSFTAANSSVPDVAKWAKTVGTGPGTAIGVQNNALRLSSGYSGGGYNSNDTVSVQVVLGTTLVDAELEYCLTSGPVTVDSYLQVALRSVGKTPWDGAAAYYLQHTQNAGGTMLTTVIKRAGSVDTVLFTVPALTMTAGKKTWFRFRVKGTKLTLWTWADGAQVPTVPVWSGTDSSVTAGGYASFALLRTGTAAAVQNLDSIAVYAL